MADQILKIIVYMLLAYFVIINLWAFFAFGWDKRKAIKDKWRTPEKKLIQLALLGGSIGALAGMKVFHHKTKKMKFSVGIPLILIAQVSMIAVMIYLINR